MLLITLLLVSNSVLRGAEVTLCSRKPNSEFTAGLLSAALFSWFSPYVSLGQTKQLDLDDLPVQVTSIVKPYDLLIQGCFAVGNTWEHGFG